MSKDILDDIINDFNPEKFIKFFRTKNTSFSPRQEELTQYNDVNFKNGKKLGEINFKDNSLFIYSFQAEQALSEKSGKKAQYEKGKKILKETQADAGIFIYYDQSDNFRFSLIYANYIGSKRDWSTFRRFTYFVSKEFTNKTFLGRIGDGDFSSLEKIKDAFNVEKVTKEFYLEYRKLFDDLVGNLSKNHTFINEAIKNNINTENFAKKLLGQIVFIYFLQKKGWLGVPAGEKWGKGDQKFLSNLFIEATDKNKNYYNDYLEKLFYAALNNSKRESADPSFSKIFNCRIPFLNGGLFEPEYEWEKSFMYLDNKIFGRILETFDRYNFTVEEESPEDKEVAIDPEMLGKVFENLLPENLKKGTGTFYTPREIVHFMCQESLINYLSSSLPQLEEQVRDLIHFGEFSITESPRMIVLTPEHSNKLDDLLMNIRIVDPACGSGAFLVGMLHEVVKARLYLSYFNQENITEYSLKKESIQNCIYGVDIDPGAIDIAKLRLWLSLVVDYELEEIEPLPNLDYKLMVGNSLIEKLDAQISAITRDPERNKLIYELRELKGVFFSLSNSQEKKELKTQINELILLIENYDNEKKRQSILDNILDRNRQVKLFDLGNEQQTLVDIPSQIKQSGTLKDVKETDHFEWHLNFNEIFEKGGFDVVLANPPYVRQEEILEYKEALQKNYKIFSPRSDLYTYFYETGINLLKEHGILTFISSNKFMRAKYGIHLRNYLKQNTSIKKIIDFGDKQMFEAITNTVIIIIKKNYEVSNNIWFGDDIEIQEGSIINQDILDESAWTLADKKNLDIKYKMEEKGVLLKNWAVEISYGVKTSLNDAFIINESKKEELIRKDPKSAKIIKRILRGRDIKKYGFIWAKLWMIGTFKQNRAWFNIEKYPSIRDHLLPFQSKLKPRPQNWPSGKKWMGRNTQPFDYLWHEIFFAPNIEEFRKEKIIWLELSDENKFAYSLDEDYVLAGAFLMTGEHLKYLLSFLNSKICKFYFKLICNSSGMGTLQWKKFAVERIPIPKLDLKNQQPFVEIVDKILVITKDEDYLQNPSKQTKVKEYEDQIDKLVYKLYDLTPEEIKIIEKN